MSGRWIIALLLFLLIVFAVAIPISWLDVRLKVAGLNGAREYGLANGYVYRAASDSAGNELLTRKSIGVDVGPAVAAQAAQVAPAGAAPINNIRVPLWWLLAGSGAILIALYVSPALRSTRRRKRALCLHCGYDLRGADERCPECGNTRTAVLRHRWPLGWLPDSAFFVTLAAQTYLLFFAVAVALGLSAWFLSYSIDRAAEYNELKPLDYLAYVRQTTPRLDGRIVSVTSGGSLTPIGNAVGPGITIVLGPGEYALSNRISLQDVAIVGDSKETTTLYMNVNGAERCLIENVTINCGNRPFIDSRDRGRLRMRNCLINTYNSGVGGSNAIYGVKNVLLIENSTFEGSTGRAAGRMNGNVFDLRRDNRLYCRGCSFVDNDEIIRSCPSVFDRCTSESTSQNDWGIMVYDRPVYTRENCATIQHGRPANTISFGLTTDDAAFLNALKDGSWPDEQSRQLAEVLGVEHDPAFWIALLLHEDADFRKMAAARVRELTEQVVRLEPDMELSLAEAIALLDSSGDIDLREAQLRLIGGGSEARAMLEALGQKGTERQWERAQVLLRLCKQPVPLHVQVEYARLMNWLEEQPH